MCWPKTEKKKTPVAATVMNDNNTAATAPASTRGTTSAWMGSTPVARSVLISSRIAYELTSTQTAVAPAAANTKTVSGGKCGISSSITSKITKTAKGIASMTVGRAATRAIENTCRKASRHKTGPRTMVENVSRVMAAKPPKARLGSRSSCLTVEPATITSSPTSHVEPRLCSKPVGSNAL
ncbi:Uncharacterised protein [Mycobacteroides abscessus subsp. abscessus]|nr:Uncharacterised protein [Mycobacteroides abscessus subsp. abscessus]